MAKEESLTLFWICCSSNKISEWLTLAEETELDVSIGICELAETLGMVGKRLEKPKTHGAAGRRLVK